MFGSVDTGSFAKKRGASVVGELQVLLMWFLAMLVVLIQDGWNFRQWYQWSYPWTRVIQALMCDSSWQTSQCFKKRLLPSSIVVVVAVLVMNNHTFFAKKVSLPPTTTVTEYLFFPNRWWMFEEWSGKLFGDWGLSILVEEPLEEEKRP